MSLTLRMDGNITIQLTDEGAPLPIPLKVAMTYTEKVIYDFSYTAPQTDTAIPQGSVTAPKFVLVFVRQGSISLSWDSGGVGGTTFTANDQVPSDVPLMFMYRGAGSAAQLYLTSTGVVRGQIWLLE